MRPRELLLLTTALCCLSCAAPPQPVSVPQEDVSDGASVVAADAAPDSRPSASPIMYFRDVPPEARSQQTVISVRVHGDEPPGYFAALGEMTHLRRMIISPSSTSRDMGEALGEVLESWPSPNSSIVFKPFLTDEFVDTLATLKELRTIEIWYGRLSEQQEATIRAALPDCVIWQNQNRL